MDYREFVDPEAWAEAAASVLTEAVLAALGRGEASRLCLAGGTTPAPVYRRFAAKLGAVMATSTFAAMAPESSTILVIPGDERLYPEQPELLNETMLAFSLREALPRVRIQSWFESAGLPGSPCNAEHMCSAMDTVLEQSLYGRTRLFDCTVLGLGADGHSAGLFRETLRKSRAAAYTAPSFPHERVSLLPGTLRDCGTTLVLAQKAGKEAAVDAMLRGNALINTCMCGNTKIFCLL